MSDDMDFNCPVCFEFLSPPILQCDNGHSTCAVCARSVEACPLCRSAMTGTRNYKLEEILEKLKNLKLRVVCSYALHGCKELLKSEDKTAHEVLCNFRPFMCEGKKFCGWECNWSGTIKDQLKHFNESHICCNSFKAEKKIKFDLTVDSKSIEAINFQEGRELFWYKHKVDIKVQKVFWLFQYVGSEKAATDYYFEFEIHSGQIRKYKITDYCKSYIEDEDGVFASESCVAVSFNNIKSFLNLNAELDFRYRIMKVKHSPTVSQVPSRPAVNVVPFIRPPYITQIPPLFPGGNLNVRPRRHRY